MVSSRSVPSACGTHKEEAELFLVSPTSIQQCPCFKKLPLSNLLFVREQNVLTICRYDTKSNLKLSTAGSNLSFPFPNLVA